MDITSTADAAPAKPGASYFPTVETALWIAGFIYQALSRVVRYDLGFDQLVQFTATQNVLRGHGLGALVAVMTDLSSTRTMKILYWPPGWSLMQIPFVTLFRNEYWATYLSDMAALALLLVAARSILHRVASSFSMTARILLVLAIGFVSAPNGNWWYANIWAEAFFVAATALVMPRGEEEAPDSACFLSGWLLGGCVWMRYQYLSTIGVIALVILLQRRFRRSVAPVAFHLAGLGISLLPLIYWRFFPLAPTVAGGATADSRVAFTGGGLHLESLLRTPAPAAVALGGDRWRWSLLSTLLPARFAEMDGVVLLGWLGWALTTLAVVGAVMALRNRSVDGPTRAGLRRFYAIGVSGYLLNLALLEYMSLIRDVHVTTWVYVQVFRYHMLASVFVLFAIAHFMSAGRGRAVTVLKILVLGAGLLMGVIQAPQAAITFRRLVKGDWGPPLETRFWNRGDAVQYLTRSYDESRHNVLVYLGSADNTATYILSMARFSGYAATSATRPDMLDTVSPVHLAVATPSEGDPDLREKFDSLCAELGPETTMGRVVLCDGRFLPRRRGHS